MGYDLVTWTPVVNTWDVPGATLIGGGIGTGHPTRMDAGDATGFSTTPTISQLNASSHWNQVIGLYNRRARQYNTLFGTTLSILPYVTNAQRIDASWYQGVVTAILALRRAEGFLGTFGFTNASSGQKILGKHLAELRQSLGCYGLVSPMRVGPSSGVTKFANYDRQDNPLGTIVSETIGTTDTRFEWDASGAPVLRRRVVLSLPIPDWMTTITRAYLETSVSGVGGSSTCHGRIYMPVSPYINPNSLSNSDFYNNTNLVYSLQESGGIFDDGVPPTTTPPFTAGVPLTNSWITARAGDYVSFLQGFDIDFDNTGAGFTTVRTAIFNADRRSDLGWYGGLVIDLG